MQAGLEGNSRPVGAVEDPALATVLKVFEHERIVAAMQALPERWRTVLWYAEVMDLPMHEVSPLLGIEPYAVSALLTRARSGLRTTYDLQTQSAQRLRNADIGKEAKKGDSIPAI